MLSLLPNRDNNQKQACECASTKGRARAAEKSASLSFLPCCLLLKDRQGNVLFCFTQTKDINAMSVALRDTSNIKQPSEGGARCRVHVRGIQVQQVPLRPRTLLLTPVSSDCSPRTSVAHLGKQIQNHRELRVRVSGSHCQRRLREEESRALYLTSTALGRSTLAPSERYSWEATPWHGAVHNLPRVSRESRAFLSCFPLTLTSFSL